MDHCVAPRHRDSEVTEYLRRRGCQFVRAVPTSGPSSSASGAKRRGRTPRSVNTRRALAQRQQPSSLGTLLLSEERGYKRSVWVKSATASADSHTTSVSCPSRTMFSGSVPANRRRGDLAESRLTHNSSVRIVVIARRATATGSATFSMRRSPRRSTCPYGNRRRRLES
jgi:hypothetical protein